MNDKDDGSPFPSHPRVKPWQRYERVSPQTAKQVDAASLLNDSEREAGSTEDLHGGRKPEMQSDGFHRMLFSQENAETRKKARIHPSWWLPEILSQVGGMVCLSAIIVILWRADGNPPPTLYMGVTLNTVLAFLTSLAKIAFLVPIVEGLGQLKWLWFLSRDYKPLIDLQIFDEAARGGVGGLKLLFRFKGFLASFGALIMLSGLFTSTLTQQVISYPVITAESHGVNDTATVDRATTFSAYDGNQLVFGAYDTAREQQAVFQGAFTAPQEPAQQVRPVCSSGDCSWPLYGSLAVCGEVVNLTAQGNQTLLATLGQNTAKRLVAQFNSSIATAEAMGYAYYFTSVPAVFPVISGLFDQPSGAFNASVTALMISDSYIAYSDQLMNNSLSAMADLSTIKYLELGFWWCTKTYSTSVRAGQHTTTEIETVSKLKEPTSPLNMPWAVDFYPCYTSGTCNATFGGKQAQLEPPSRADAGTNYTLHVWTELTASALLAATMFDSVFFDSRRGIVSSNGGGIAKTYALSLLGDFQSTALPTPETQLGNIRGVVQNMARAMTNLVRTMPSTRQTRPPSENTVHGTVSTPQAFVKINWEWTSLLAAQLALTAVFLALTIARTHVARMQVIKSSSLATLCALDKATRQQVGGVHDLDALERKAKTLGFMERVLDTRDLVLQATSAMPTRKRDHVNENR
ncbi:hypothetical protein B0T19DRAFT_481899 [Cercophora scortea]|uniref:Uncharacterized protein n=1 Tax=Cercophora scortea TaxID=314031 RepID=A0AAE0MM58_9PEZI|nr:hypothetical protein B0T19DRAFT_481899 [Cercophora scortea]